MPESPALKRAREIIATEAHAMIETASRIGTEFNDALALLDSVRKAGGRVHVSGVGKSGHIAAHIAAKMSATGTPADFLHPVEAMHGDMGRVRHGDAAILISRSGECLEMIVLAGALQGHSDRHPRVIGITQNPNSPMARYCEVVLTIHDGAEADSIGLTPTCSTAASMAMGDALAVCLMEIGDFTADDFRATHPGGPLGKGAGPFVRRQYGDDSG